MVVQHNMSAMNANRMLGNIASQQSKSTEKLSSGYRINRAGDDAAGLAISEKMRGQIRGLNQASANAQDGISLIQTAEGALTETHSVLQRMRELAVQAASDTNTDDDRSQIQNEINALTNEVDRIANTTEFNTKKLLNGDLKGANKAEDGKVAAEGDFQNGTVAIEQIGDSGTDTAFTDVIRLEVKRDFAEKVTEAGAYALEKLFNINDLFGGASGTISGNSVTANNPEIRIAITQGSLSTVGTLKINVFGKNSAGGFTSISIKIDHADRLKAGDTITITAKAKEEHEPAAVGKEALRLQIGANAGQELAVGVKSMKADDLNIVQKTGDIGQALDVTNQSSASLAINAYDLAIQSVSSERAKLGAAQNRLEHTISNLDTSSENLQTAESRIRDTDMASEMVNFSKGNILQQAAQSMLAQANQSNQGILSLLG